MKFRLARYLLPCLPLIGGGCADLQFLDPRVDETVFYYLDAASPAPTGEEAGSSPTILIGPASLAKFLDQPQIVSFTQPGQVDYADSHRWAEPLVEGLNRVLIDQIRSRLPAARVGYSRTMGGLPWDLRVGYHVDRLGGHPGQSASLRVSWWIETREGQVQRVEAATFEEPVAGEAPDYRAYVAAIQAVVGRWAKEVATSLPVQVKGPQE